MALLGGCASTPHYKVESRYVAANRADAAPEVHASAAYRELLPELRRVALRAPIWADSPSKGAIVSTPDRDVLRSPR